MPRKKHETAELIALKSFYGSYTNRITIKRQHVGREKLDKALIDSNLDYKLSNGYHNKMIYYKSDDHYAMMNILINIAKVRHIESITRPYNDRAKTEMIGDKHLLIVKALPFKKFRYKVTLKHDSTGKLRDIDLGFLKSQVEVGTMRISWNLAQKLKTNSPFNWYWMDNYFYVEDEATTSMTTLMYSDVIDKIYIYKTYEEMNTNE